MEAMANPEAVGLSKARLARLGPWMSRWVDAGHLPGALTLVARRGEIAYLDCVGHRDVASATPWTTDTMVRVYSMTKPVTSIALMMLFEEGRVHLDDPVQDFIPDLKDPMVLVPGATALDQVEPCTVPMTVEHLLTHTSGYTYGFQGGILGDAYTAEKIDFGPRRGGLDAMLRKLGALPILFQPGTRWNYGVSTDVVGRLVEVISGQDLATFFRSRIFEPLGMVDTAFGAPAAKLDRFASLYTPNPDGSMKVLETAERSAFRLDGTDTWSGGGGLVSTVGDYFRFAEMIRRKGRVGSERLIGPRTLSFMASNHLPGDLASMGQPKFSEVSYVGIGFGLGFAVMLNPAISSNMGSVGDHGWGGMASTVFWVDPVEDMTVIFMTQLAPSSSYPLRKELRALVYSSLID